MRVTVYKSTTHGEHEVLAEALASGFRAIGDEVTLVEIKDYTKSDNRTQLACFPSVSMAYKEIYRNHQRASRHTLLVDKGYFHSDKYYRFALDGFQSRFLQAKGYPFDRAAAILADWGIKLGEYHYDEKRALAYIGMTQAYASWFGIEHAAKFDMTTARYLTVNLSSRYGRVYCKPLEEVPADDSAKSVARRVMALAETIEELITKSDVVVTHSNSQPSILAAILGVPTVVLTQANVNAAFPIAGNGSEATRDPPIPTEEVRRQWLANLAYHQFTIKEIRSGFAMQHLTDYTVKRLAPTRKLFGLESPRYMAAQYQLMHEMGRYSGGLTKDFIAQIKQLVEQCDAQTLLDYGSGKGRQYSEYKQHKEWGGIEPICYDPGYPPFSTRPSGKFDGVICTDVAEHIPENEVDWFLEDVIGYANKFVFFCIFTGLAAKCLPDGRNAHLTVRDEKWWVQKLVLALKKRGTARLTDRIDNKKDQISMQRLQTEDFSILAMFRHKEGKE